MIWLWSISIVRVKVSVKRYRRHILLHEYYSVGTYWILKGEATQSDPQWIGQKCSSTH